MRLSLNDGALQLQHLSSAVKTSSSVSSLLFRFWFILWEMSTDNHDTKNSTASVNNWIGAWMFTDTLESVAWNGETQGGCTAVYKGIGGCLQREVVVFKILTTYLPNCFLTGRAVSLRCTVLVSTSLISFLNSCHLRVWPFRAIEVLMCSYNCFLIVLVYFSTTFRVYIFTYCNQEYFTMKIVLIRHIWTSHFYLLCQHPSIFI